MVPKIPGTTQKLVYKNSQLFKSWLFTTQTHPHTPPNIHLTHIHNVQNVKLILQMYTHMYIFYLNYNKVAMTMQKLQSLL